MRAARQPACTVLVAGALVFALVVPALAQDIGEVNRALTTIEGDADALTRVAIRPTTEQSRTHVEERLTDGELFYRLRDYVRASIIFTDIVDNYPTHPAYPDALFLLGESLYSAGDYLGARTRFRQILERADQQPFRPYVQRTLGRLIEIAIHTRDFDGVEGYFERLSRLPPSEIEAATQYFRAKYLYNSAVPTDEVMRETQAERAATSGTGAQTSAPLARLDPQRLDQARDAFEAVQERSPYYPQARYFIGVIFTLRQQFPQAIEAFRRVLRADSTTPEHQQITDLAQLALGRLYYETDQLDQAIEAYQSVPRTSAVFDVALYEIAWVYIRQGDSTRAERALEVLTVAAPDSRFIPDAEVLRGNLLLRNGRFEDANGAFDSVRTQFGPVRDELVGMLEGRGDPRAFFQDLVRRNLESFDANAFLPPLAIRWARTEGDMDRALTVLADLSQARTLVRETGELISRLNAALGAANRVNAFPDLRRVRERSVALRNRLSRVRSQLIAAEARLQPNAGGELGEVRARRREIEEFLGRLPTTQDDFTVRADRALDRYRTLERSLRELEVELMGIEARAVATERFVNDTAAQRDPSGVQATLAELANHRAAVQTYRDEIAQIRLAIEAARVQVGVGDSSFQRDERLRAEYSQLVERERALLTASGAVPNRELDGMFGRIAQVEARLDAKDREVDTVVEQRTADLRRQLDEEIVKVDGYRAQLAELETEAVDVVGGVTWANFDHVRGRFYDIVLRADVGRIDVAWLVREEHRTRAENLSRDRQHDLQALDDEFRDIIDTEQSAEPEAPAPPPAATPPAPPPGAP